MEDTLGFAFLYLAVVLFVAISIARKEARCPSPPCLFEANAEGGREGAEPIVPAASHEEGPAGPMKRGLIP